MDQRARNRVIEALEVLAAGDEGVRGAGNAEYVNGFFDWIDDDAWDGAWRESSALTPDEVNALDDVQQLLLSACAATPRICSDEEFIASGWPERIRPAAARALASMLNRGRFSEDHEERSPST